MFLGPNACQKKINKLLGARLASGNLHQWRFSRFGKERCYGATRVNKVAGQVEILKAGDSGSSQPLPNFDATTHTQREICRTGKLSNPTICYEVLQYPHPLVCAEYLTIFESSTSSAGLIYDILRRQLETKTCIHSSNIRHLHSSNKYPRC